MPVLRCMVAIGDVDMERIFSVHVLLVVYTAPAKTSPLMLLLWFLRQRDVAFCGWPLSTNPLQDGPLVARSGLLVLDHAVLIRVVLKHALVDLADPRLVLGLLACFST